MLAPIQMEGGGSFARGGGFAVFIFILSPPFFFFRSAPLGPHLDGDGQGQGQKKKTAKDKNKEGKEKIIPFFDKYKIVGVNSQDYEDLKKVVDIMKVKGHLRGVRSN